MLATHNWAPISDGPDRWWKDVDGNPMVCMANSIIKVGNIYYMYGEWCFSDENSGENALRCYSSTDLAHWKFEANVLTQKNSHLINYGNMIYNPTTKMYVYMYKYRRPMVFPGWKFGDGILAWATCSTPTGEFKIARKDPRAGIIAGGCNYFKDDDGTVYATMDGTYVAGEGKHMGLFRLSSDYCSLGTRIYDFGPVGEDHEGIVVRNFNGLYYAFVSGLNGWGASSSYYKTASNLAGPWSSEWTLIPTDPSSEDQWGSQAIWTFDVTGSTSSFPMILTRRHWDNIPIHPISVAEAIANSWGARPCNLWLPLQWNGTAPTTTHYKTWYIDAATGTWTADPKATGTPSPATATPSPVITATLAVAGTIQPTNLRCEFRQNPLGLDVVQPRLSWTLEAPQGARNQVQSAYRVLVASTLEMLTADRGDLWDSGKVESDQTIHVVYTGKPLQSRMRVWWKVRTWDKDSQPSEWSAPAAWTMGLLQPSDWKAKWIADPDSVTNTAQRGHHNVLGHINGYHSQTATTADVTKWVAVDLGKPQTFDAVRLFPARPYGWQPDTPGFLFPVRFKIEAASNDDFSDARVIFDRTASDEPNPGTNAPLYRFDWTTARYVRLLVTRMLPRDGNKFAFALAEMQVLNGETNLAKNAKVLALDSIETRAWAKICLTDGILTTMKSCDGAGALPATMIRKPFQLDRSIKRATAYASALGIYELRLNGQRVGDQLLAPEWTSYRKRVHYQVHDVTALLCKGENTVAAQLGEGWFAGRLFYIDEFTIEDYIYFLCGPNPSFLLQLEIEFADGQTEIIYTDSSWRTTINGPIRNSGIYDGEVYDARKEQTGWDSPGFDASAWRYALSSELDARSLIWQRNEAIQVEKELEPIKMTEPKPGVFVFDLGQNMVGWARAKAIGTASKTVTIRHAEMLNDDGTINTDNLFGGGQIDYYTPLSDGEFTYEPCFTYHGFRFVELTGLAQPPSINAVLGRVFHSSSPIVGRFECSDPSLNQLMQNILWTQRANLMSTATDCPQRDERLGWLGDIQCFAQTAIFNMDMAAFFTKYTQDIRDDQSDDGCYPDFAPHPGNPNKTFIGSPGWGDAGTIIPWRAFQNYADTRLLTEHFDSARRWVDYIHKNNPSLIWAKWHDVNFNDWLNSDKMIYKNWPTRGGEVPLQVFATAFFAHSTEIVAKMAEILGRKDEARHYGELFKQIKAVFNQNFVKDDGTVECDTQGGYALALSFNLLPDDLRPKAAQLLVENIHRYQNHLSTGIQTTHHAMLELTRNSYNEIAWQLLTNRTFPSWLYMIDNGATTIWERWDGYVKGRALQKAGMKSFNHWALGAVGEWMWKHIAGLNPDDAEPGWKHFVIAPKPGGGVTWVKAEYQSIRGRIASDWKIEGDKFTLCIAIPPNTTATVFVPTTDASKIIEGGKPVSAAGTSVECARFEVGSGTFEFGSPIANQ